MSHAVNQSVGAARRVGKAVTKRMRAATGQVDAGVGVGDDESSFGGSRARVWFEEVVDETRKKLLNILERSVFERFPKLEKLVRRVLGEPRRTLAPELPPPRKGPTGPLGAHVPKASPEAERFKAQIQRRLHQAHTEEHAGLRDTMDRRRRGDSQGEAPEDPPGPEDPYEDEPL